MFKVIIAGGRDFTDYNALKDAADFALSRSSDIEIVSGRCSTGTLTFIADDKTRVYGADGLGERYAKERGYPVKYFPADWSLGAIGGPLRNVQMAVYADALISFWDGKSSGTAHMIKEAKKLRRKVKVVAYGKKVKKKKV